MQVYYMMKRGNFFHVRQFSILNKFFKENFHLSKIFLKMKFLEMIFEV